MNIIIATIKSWNVENANELKEKYKEIHDIRIVCSDEELNKILNESFVPDYIFFPHWSSIIPKEVYEKYECVVFHMTDLPYGRGGSPLQNLIVRGVKNTVISALRVTREIDAGPIYMKEPLELSGSAEEILRRASKLIFDTMIPKFIAECPSPVEQVGEVVTFKRRKPIESELQLGFEVETIYNYIRMLDAEGYPKAFIKYGANVVEFSNADYDGEIVRAQVTIRRNEDE